MFVFFNDTLLSAFECQIVGADFNDSIGRDNTITPFGFVLLISVRVTTNY